MPLTIVRKSSTNSLRSVKSDSGPQGQRTRSPVLGKLNLLPSARISRAPISPPSSPDLDQARIQSQVLAHAQEHTRPQEVARVPSPCRSYSATRSSRSHSRAPLSDGSDIDFSIFERGSGNRNIDARDGPFSTGAISQKHGYGSAVELSKALQQEAKGVRAKEPESSWYGDRTFEIGLECFKKGDYSEAVRLYTEAANHGSRSALHNLGVMFLHGQGVTQDTKRAREYFTLGALEGVAESMSQLGYMDMYGEGSNGYEPDYQRARLWFVRAVQQGDMGFAAYQLGVLYALGQGVEQSYELAAQWLEVSSSNGYLHAQYNLGAMYYQGLGVPRDPKRAATLYRRAAKQGHVLALNNLAAMYFAGDGVRQDYDKAYRLARVAAQAQVPEAMFNVSDAFLAGRGAQRDPREALTWLQRAAAASFPEAQFVLGCIHLFKPTNDESSDKARENVARARELFEAAAGAGHKSAAHNLRLLNKLSEEQDVTDQKSIREKYHTQFATPEPVNRV